MSKMDILLKTAKFGLKHGGKLIVKHAPTILTGVGTVGVIASLVLTAKKTPDAKKELDKEREEWKNTPDKEKRVKADYIFKLVRIGAQHYWVVIAVATGSIVCFWLANHISLKRLMSAITALGLATKSKEDLEQKIRELDGEKHLQKLKDEIDADLVRNNPPVEGKIYDTGLGLHLCMEPITGRYFYSNMELVKQAFIVAREYLQKEGYLSLNELFDLLKLDTTDQNLCWTADSLEEVNEFGVSFSSQMTADGRPVLVLRYDVNPSIEYRRDW